MRGWSGPSASLPLDGHGLFHSFGGDWAMRRCFVLRSLIGGVRDGEAEASRIRPYRLGLFSQGGPFGGHLRHLCPERIGGVHHRAGLEIQRALNR